ncbi:hypothetical protein OCU04_012485 [Sclerotinia nivalis]|uniref:Uncharacterized protein n=1 Tax=Sclerotinia nivalis TaxID=352851 RepID=A0A9X0DCF2_9HELO|nr:hypothetical protein OCU04_012485 [Sclerotinia nivalis]
MRLSQAQPQLLSLILLTLSHSSPVSAGPFPKDDIHDLGFSYLMDRSCVSYCGADNQYCCTAGQACFTSSGDVAYCSSSTGGSGGWAVYTTTYTQTDLHVGTSTYSSYTATTTSGGNPAICDTGLGQTSCGLICCTSDQMCEYSGQCTARTSAWTYTPTSGTYSAPLRPTSGASTKTATVSATTTEPFIPPATASGSTLPITSSSSNNLSAGAIAGIVIGTILGVILLLLLCFCCVVKGLWDSVLGVFAGGKPRRQGGGGMRTERIETVERYSRHGSTMGGGAAARREQTGFFGGARADKPMRVEETRKKKSSGLGGLGAVGAGLAGLAVVLGLKKKEDERRDEKMRPGPTATATEISSTYYTDSYTGTSASEYFPVLQKTKQNFVDGD